MRSARGPDLDLSVLRPILDTALDAVLVMTADGLIAGWNAPAESTFGWRADEVLGRPMAEVVVPPRFREAHRNGIARFQATGEARVLGRRIEIAAVRRDGVEFPVELSITRAVLAGRAVFVGFIRDISDRRRDEELLRQAEARLRATQEHALIGIGEVDEHGRFQRVNQALCDTTGYDRHELTELSFLELTHPDDRARDAALFASQVDGELDTYAIEKRYTRRDGRVIWVLVSASAVRSRDGQFLYGVRVVQDVTERRLAQERQKLLLDELNHRVKNTLATVISIAIQTGRRAPDYPEFRKRFEERILALSKTHDLLTRESWEGSFLHELIEAELQPYVQSPGAVRIGGPPARLDARTTLSLGLILHELATNAAKYGALSVASGTVEIDWTAPPVDAGRLVTFRWRERGGPPAPAKPDWGFGWTLIERVAQGELRGRATIGLADGGLDVRLEFILPTRDEAAARSATATDLGLGEGSERGRNES